MNIRKKIAAVVASGAFVAGIGGYAIAQSQEEDPNVPPAVVDSQGNSPDGSRRVVVDEGNGQRSVTYFDPPSAGPARPHSHQ